jgi:uncharacterized lipoprotein NlpE involved in copper resistance
MVRAIIVLLSLALALLLVGCDSAEMQHHDDPGLPDLHRPTVGVRGVQDGDFVSTTRVVTITGSDKAASTSSRSPWTAPSC